MTLLDFARGPALQAAFAIFLLGTLWRLVALLALPRNRDLSVPKPDAPSGVVAGLGGIVRHMAISKQLGPVPKFAAWNGYVFHVGLAVIVLGFTQHILVIEGLFGLSWAGLSTGVITVVAVITLGSLIAALVRRMTSPVMRLISTANDYLSWLITVLPVLTGLMAATHLGARYETLLALHILSIAVLLIWFPFGKLFHAVLVWITRGQTGAFYRRRGVKI